MPSESYHMQHFTSLTGRKQLKGVLQKEQIHLYCFVVSKKEKRTSYLGDHTDGKNLLRLKGRQ